MFPYDGVVMSLDTNGRLEKGDDAISPWLNKLGAYDIYVSKEMIRNDHYQ